MVSEPYIRHPATKRCVGMSGVKLLYTPANRAYLDALRAAYATGIVVGRERYGENIGTDGATRDIETALRDVEQEVMGWVGVREQSMWGQPPLTEETIKSLARELEFVQARLPDNAALFIGECSVAACEIYLAGFASASHALGVMHHPEITEKVATGRGWDAPGDKLLSRMRERGLTELEVMDELFNIAIGVLRCSLPQARAYQKQKG